MYRLEEMNNDLNMVCLDANSKAYVYDGDEDSDEIKSFLKKFTDSKQTLILHLYPKHSSS